MRSADISAAGYGQQMKTLRQEAASGVCGQNSAVNLLIGRLFYHVYAKLTEPFAASRTSFRSPTSAVYNITVYTHGTAAQACF